MDLFYLGIHQGLIIAITTLFTTLILDFFSMSYVFRLFKRKNGKELYLKSLYMNIINHFFLGTLSYALFTYLFSSQIAKSYYFITIEVIFLLLIQSFGYYLAHIMMHTPKLYFIHKFHHQYSDLVVPMSANAVSIYEYILAYMMPFITGIIIINPDRLSLRITISLVSFANLCIHTPWLSDISDKYIPDYFVKTTDHLEHHKFTLTKYAAPIINLDYIFKNMFKK